MLPERSCFIGVLPLVAVVCVCLGACERRPAQSEAALTLRIGAALPTERVAGSGLNALIDSLTTEALVTNGLDGRQSDRLAKSWQWDESGTVLRMTLRPEVFFHDGTPLTPALVVNALRSSIAKHDAFSLSSIASVDVSGTDGIEIKLTAPNSFLLPDLSLTAIGLPNHPEVGTGPFRLVKRGSPTVLAAFDRYYQGRPAIRNIEIDTYPNQRNAWASMMRGEVDMVHEVSRDAAEFVEAESTVRNYTFPRSYYIPLVFNVRHPALRQPEVRRALNESVDREALIREGLRGRGRPADGPIWPEHWAYSAASRPFAFNPDAARLRLDTAGWKVRPQPGGQMPSRFSFTCLVYADDPRFERLALVLQRQLADVGVDMRLQPIRQRELIVRAAKGDFDAFLIEMAGRSLSWTYAFWHSPQGLTLIDTGYRSADTVLDRIRSARSDDEIRGGISDLAQLLYDDPPAVFIAWQVQSRAVSTAFEVPVDDNRDILSSVWQWRLAPGAHRASQ